VWRLCRGRCSSASSISRVLGHRARSSSRSESLSSPGCCCLLLRRCCYFLFDLLALWSSGLVLSSDIPEDPKATCKLLSWHGRSSRNRSTFPHQLAKLLEHVRYLQAAPLCTCPEEWHRRYPESTERGWGSPLRAEVVIFLPPPRFVLCGESRSLSCL